MNREGDHIENQRHLTESQLIQYSEGTMADAEMHRVELHLLSCELCSEALEGIELLDTGAKKPAMIALHSRFQGRLRSNNPAPKVAYWKWAAVAAIFLMSAAVLFVLLNKNVNPQSEIAIYQGHENNSLPTLRPAPLVELEKDSVGVSNTFALDNTIALNTDKNAFQSNSKKRNLNSRSSNAYRADESQFEREVSVTTAPGEEVLEPSAFMEAAETDSEVNIALQDSNKVGEMLAGRSMGLQFSKGTRIKLDKQVSGKVLDEGGNPLPGANILIKGSSIGVISDVEGAYKIPLQDPNSSLLISSIGFVTEEIDLTETDSTLITTLTPDVTALSEVVVTGYGTRKKQDVTGSVASLKSRTQPAPGIGTRRFNKYIRENLTTESAAQAGVEGSITISFSVEKNGSLGGFEIIVPAGYGLDEKLVQLIEDGPEWIPARDGDGPVREKVILNIPFEIKKE